MTQGIHHITAIASNGQKNIMFYTQVLGLRLVKKTVNQDDIQTYHLFFGDRLGHPGMDLTFFIFLPPEQGKRGNGLVTMISLAVPEQSLSFWKERFTSLNVRHNNIIERFGKKRLVFFDEDDQQLELVGVPEKELEKDAEIWTTSEITSMQAIRSFYGATLTVPALELIEPILTSVFGYDIQDEEGVTTLYKVPHSDRAAYLEVLVQPDQPFGHNTAGTVHHIAFRARDEQHQKEFVRKLDLLGIGHTDAVERFYFKSIYFRTPSGILFEIATDGPGFTADEDAATLGEKLALPPFLEPHRAYIESVVPKLEGSKL